MSITRELARYGRAIDFRKIPPEVVDRVKYLFLDFIAVAARGVKQNSSRSLFRFIRKMGLTSKSGVIIGSGGKAPFLYAALANGTSAHAIEMDDVHNESSLHPGVAVFPAVLAMAEATRAGGERFIAAAVLGYEIMIRLGKALGAENSYKRGFHPTGTCGVFGSAMAASKLLGLKTDPMINALGIAGSQAAGSMEYLAQGAWTKRFHAGWAAHSGMIAALLARNGFQGPSTIIEGRDGFLHAYSNGAQYEKVLEGIGSGFEIMRTSVKPFACCRYMHPPIDGLLNIIREYQLYPKQIKKVRLGILRAGSQLIAEPIRDKYSPQSIVDAQFSMPFGAAVAMVYRKAGLNEFQLSKIQSGEVKAMMQKVECTINPELDKTFPKQWSATVEVWDRKGKKYFNKVEYPKGDPENPLSWEELKEKFHDLCGPIFKQKQRRQIVDQVMALEKVPDFSRWSRVLLKNSLTQ